MFREERRGCDVIPAMRGKQLCGVEVLAVVFLLLLLAGASCEGQNCSEGTVVVSCSGASCATGMILGDTLLQQALGQGPIVCSTLWPGNTVEVDCRTEDALVYDDAWWLRSRFNNGTANFTGWVADYYVDCGNIDICNVTVCS